MLWLELGNTLVCQGATSECWWLVLRVHLEVIARLLQKVPLASVFAATAACLNNWNWWLGRTRGIWVRASTANTGPASGEHIALGAISAASELEHLVIEVVDAIGLVGPADPIDVDRSGHSRLDLKVGIALNSHGHGGSLSLIATIIDTERELIGTRTVRNNRGLGHLSICDGKIATSLEPGAIWNLVKSPLIGEVLGCWEHNIGTKVDTLELVALECLCARALDGHLWCRSTRCANSGCGSGLCAAILDLKLDPVLARAIRLEACVWEGVMVVGKGGDGGSSGGGGLAVLRA
jgi:hypothetical protein